MDTRLSVCLSVCLSHNAPRAYDVSMREDSAGTTGGATGTWPAMPFLAIVAASAPQGTAAGKHQRVRACTVYVCV
jgi:hypothetical protein